MTEQAPGWSEQDSQQFIDYGAYLVPEREQQLATICALLPSLPEPFTVLELACGEGLLAEAILRAHPRSRVVGLDRSAAMRRRAAERLAPFDGRFRAEPFELADTAWRRAYRGVGAVVSSLTIHHLDGAGKRALFRDLRAMLAPGGALVIADVVDPPSSEAAARYADEWDEAVRRRALAPGGDPAALAFFERERWNMYRYPEPEGYDQPSRLIDQLEWLRAAGFHAVDAHWMLAGHAIFGGRAPCS